MSDDATNNGGDHQLVSLERPHEVRAWCKSLGCDELELRAAVYAVGRSAAKVRAYLDQQAKL